MLTPPGTAPDADPGRWVPIVLLLVSPVLGFGTRFPWSLLPLGLGRALWTVAAIGFLALLLIPRARAAVAARAKPLPREAVWIRVLLVADAGMLLLNFLYFRSLGYGFPLLGLLLCAAGLLVVPRRPMVGAVVISAALLVASIQAFPLPIERSDMLPVIRLALDHWWAGTDPYDRLPMPSGTPYMPYLPGLFFSHLPAWALGVDLRWNSVLYRLIWGLLLARKLVRLPVGSPLRICALLLLLNPYLVFRHDLYFEFSLLLAAGFWMLPKARWAILALAVLTRQWAWVLTPFLLLGATRPRPRDRATAALQLAGWILVWSAVFWILLHRTTSLQSISIVVGKFQALVGDAAYYGDYGLTLQPLLRAVGLQPATQVLQAAAVAVLLVLALRAAPARAMWLGFAALAVVLEFNVLYWNYFAFELAIWILGWELWLAGDRESRRPRAPAQG